MNKFLLGSKWRSQTGLPLEVIKELNYKKGEVYIHFKIIGTNPPLFWIRYESECSNFKPLEK